MTTGMAVGQGVVLLGLAVNHPRMEEQPISYATGRRFLLSFAEQAGRGHIRFDVVSGAGAWSESFPAWQAQGAVNQLAGTKLPNSVVTAPTSKNVR